MNDEPVPALSFAGVAGAYDRARPSYPRQAAEWLTGSTPVSVLELGAGTGKFTDQLLAIGHDVLATDPLEEMLTYLQLRHPKCRTAVASAEELQVNSRSVDVVVCAQSFHWFDLDKALPEIARVLKPEGTLALVWNRGDTRIPWVRRLDRILHQRPSDDDPGPADDLIASRLFGYVEEQTFRHWQPLRKQELRENVLSRSYIVTKPEAEREQMLRQVDALYDEYGRGPDGLLMPYLTHCYKAVVRPVVHEDTGPIHLDHGDPVRAKPDEDDGTQLFSLS